MLNRSQKVDNWKKNAYINTIQHFLFLLGITHLSTMWTQTILICSYSVPTKSAYLKWYIHTHISVLTVCGVLCYCQIEAYSGHTHPTIFETIIYIYMNVSACHSIVCVVHSANANKLMYKYACTILTLFHCSLTTHTLTHRECVCLPGIYTHKGRSLYRPVPLVPYTVGTN